MDQQALNYLRAALFGVCGFQAAQSTTIPTILKKINPTNGTAMRDSLIEGSKLMLNLYKALAQTKTAHHWNFVHVILTDGVDCDSKNSLEQAIAMMILIGHALPVQTLKIIFIGVGVQNKAEKELMLLAEAGGKNAEYYNVNSSQIENIFNKIEISLGLQTRLNVIGIKNSQMSAVMVQEQHRPVVQVKMKNFAVMFNLDVSGSMSGTKWTNVCKSVDGFISKMGNTDVVSGLVFNNEVKLLMNITQNDVLFQRPRSSSISVANKPKTATNNFSPNKSYTTLNTNIKSPPTTTKNQNNSPTQKINTTHINYNQPKPHKTMSCCGTGDCQIM